MRASQHNLNSFIMESFEKNGNGNIDSVLELLWYRYRKDYPIDNEELRVKTQELEPFIKPLSERRKLHLRYRIYELRAEHEREAFISGVQAGVQLILELQNWEENK